MSVILTILYTVLLFGFLIFIHELGHYVAARSFGVGVREFAMEGQGQRFFDPCFPDRRLCIHGRRNQRRQARRG